MDTLLKKVKDMEAMIKKQAKKMKTQKRVLENWYRAVETVVDGHNRHVESIKQLQEKVFPTIPLNDSAVHQLAAEYLDELYDVKKEWEAGLEEDEDEEDEEDEDKEFEEDKAEEKGE